MFFVRVAVLGFWVAYSWAMGHQGSLNGFGEVVAGSFFIAAPVLYLLPTIEAWRSGRENLTSIAALNVLLGWSVVGWVAAAVWALKRPSKQVDGWETKKCQFCAEDVHVLAVKCKHCGSDLAVMPV
jgi:Superinfection immunity protein